MSDQNTEPTGDGSPTQKPDVSQTPTAPKPDETPQAAFTQADIDRIVKERIAREREKYQDYDDLKKAAAKLAELEEAQLSEQERLQKQLAEAQEARERAETMARQRAVRSALIAEAAKLNFNDPADAYRLLDLDAIEFDDAGEVKNAAKLVKELADQRKYLIKSGRTLEPFDPSGGEPVRETDAQRRARIYGGNAGFFDPNAAGRMGGGVIWPKGMPQNEE